jgi:hypothetical protein
MNRPNTLNYAIIVVTYCVVILKMIIKIRIRTPEGHAEQNEKRIRSVILGMNRNQVKIINQYVNKDNSMFFWEIEAPVKDCLRIQKNVSRFDTVMKNVFNARIVKRQLRKRGGMTPEQEKELQILFDDQTKVDIIKAAKAEEIVEANKTWWQRMTETFKKK